MPAPPSGGRPAPVRRTLLYRQATGRRPPLLRPRTFTEKLDWRVTMDRRALLAPTCDKLTMKDHARRLAPGLVRVPETLWSGTDVGELADVDLPGHWVLKPNHSCIRRLFGRGPADVSDLRRRTAGWVEERYWRKSEEWAYRRARSCLLGEEFIGVPGVVPVMCGRSSRPDRRSGTDTGPQACQIGDLAERTGRTDRGYAAPCGAPRLSAVVPGCLGLRPPGSSDRGGIRSVRCPAVRQLRLDALTRPRIACRRGELRAISSWRSSSSALGCSTGPSTGGGSP